LQQAVGLQRCVQCWDHVLHLAVIHSCFCELQMLAT